MIIKLFFIFFLFLKRGDILKFENIIYGIDGNVVIIMFNWLDILNGFNILMC